MQHRIVPRFAAWPARYVVPASRARERRLGLHAGPVYSAAPSRRTVLRSPDAGPLTALRAPWRALVVAPSRRVRNGRPRPVEAMAWTSSDRVAGAHRPTPAPAWRA